jgi:hypothetical protein
MKLHPMLLAAAMVASVATTARAQSAPSDTPPEVSTPRDVPAMSMRARFWRDFVGRFELGYRGVFVTNPGYNPFSSSDYFSGLSMAASHTIGTRGRLSFALGVSWDYGKSGTVARGDATSLDVHRLTVPLEGRAHFGRWGYAFLRVAPGAAMEHAELDDSSAPSALTKTRWLFTTDASAGYAFPVVPFVMQPGRSPRVWLQGDFGYSWIADQRLDLSPNVDLGTLGLRGAFFRVAAAVSY